MGELELTLSRVGDDADYDPLGTPGRLEPVARVGPPFNYPTHAIEAPDREIHVSDGHGNARIQGYTSVPELGAAGEPECVSEREQEEITRRVHL